MGRKVGKKRSAALTEKVGYLWSSDEPWQYLLGISKRQCGALIRVLAGKYK